MKLPNVGDVIATRMLHLVGEDAAEEIQVRIGKPCPFPDGKEVYCPYQITVRWKGAVRRWD